MCLVKNITNMRKEMSFSTNMYAVKKRARKEKYRVQQKLTPDPAHECLA